LLTFLNRLTGDFRTAPQFRKDRDCRDDEQNNTAQEVKIGDLLEIAHDQRSNQHDHGIDAQYDQEHLPKWAMLGWMWVYFQTHTRLPFHFTWLSNRDQWLAIRRKQTPCSFSGFAIV
jgi:hypothetical protein